MSTKGESPKNKRGNNRFVPKALERTLNLLCRIVLFEEQKVGLKRIDAGVKSSERGAQNSKFVEEKQ